MVMRKRLFLAAAAIVFFSLVVTASASHAPTSLSIVRYSAKTVTVGWSAVPGVTGYGLFVDGTRVATAGASATQAKFGTPEWRRYVLGVSALKTGGATSTITVDPRWVTVSVDIPDEEEPPPPPPAQCADGLDNDGDTKVDLADPGCANATDNDETDVVQPPGGRVYSWGFDAPNCTGDVWARSSWLTPACSDPAWYVEGIYYSVTSDRPTRVLAQDASGYNSTGTWQAWVHNPLTVDGTSWGTEHRIDISVKFVKWGTQAQSICSWAGGPKIFMGRPLDKYETHTYTVELQVCDGSVHIQKKEWGIFRCGQDPRAVDCGAGGTWYLLANARPGAMTLGAWHTLTAIKRDNADGSVTLIGMRDGVEVIRYTEVPNDLPVGPLRGGRDGWRSNAIDWHMDSYTVTVK
jgi:hypothetical protein